VRVTIVGGFPINTCIWSESKKGIVLLLFDLEDKKPAK